MEKVRQAFLPASDKKSIFYNFAVPGNCRAHIIICHGYGEHSGRFEHVLRSLAAKRYACFAPDHRGHGRSAGPLGYIKSFQRILLDIHELRLFIRREYGDLPLFFLGHSMGTLAAINYLAAHQDGVRGAVLIAPMIILPEYISPLLKKISGLISALLPLLPIQDFAAAAQATRDQEIQALADKDPLCYHGKIRARTGVEMLRAMEYANDHLADVSLPLLIMQGGDDKILPPESSTRAYELAASKDKTLKIFPGLYHELLNEPEKETVIKYLAGWIGRKLK